MKNYTQEIIEFLKLHRTFFETEFSVSKMGIFGSYARGEARDDSDIDIVVELKKPDLFCLIGIKQTIEEEFGGKVDIVRLRENMNLTLKKRIEKDVIYV